MAAEKIWDGTGIIKNKINKGKDNSFNILRPKRKAIAPAIKRIILKGLSVRTCAFCPIKKRISAMTEIKRPVHELLIGILESFFLFCQRINRERGTIKNPWEYSSELSHKLTKLFQTEKKVKQKAARNNSNSAGSSMLLSEWVLLAMFSDFGCTPSLSGAQISCPLEGKRKYLKRLCRFRPNLSAYIAVTTRQWDKFKIV